MSLALALAVSVFAVLFATGAASLVEAQQDAGEGVLTEAMIAACVEEMADADAEEAIVILAPIVSVHDAAFRDALADATSFEEAIDTESTEVDLIGEKVEPFVEQWTAQFSVDATTVLRRIAGPETAGAVITAFRQKVESLAWTCLAGVYVLRTLGPRLRAFFLGLAAIVVALAVVVGIWLLRRYRFAVRARSLAPGPR